MRAVAELDRSAASGFAAPNVALVASAHSAEAIATLVSAFTEDPVERWMYPELDGYLLHFPRFVAAFGGGSFRARSAWELEGMRAVALWYPPGVEPDGDAISAILSATLAEDKRETTFAVLEQMDARHPTYPHWYLPWYGVHAESQGLGHGTRLMDACLRVVEADRLPIYLETPNPRTVPFYEQFGFASVAEIRAGSCPPLICMERPARS
jgi:ribosomal protein S18 acetylase RimI-like enzyme